MKRSKVDLSRETIEQFLDQDSPVAYRALFAKIFGVSAGVMLSQADYWQRRVIRDRSRWWRKTEQQWIEELGFHTRKAVATARRVLVEAGVLEYRLKGMPRTAYYRVNYAALTQRIAEYLTPVVSDGDNKMYPLDTSCCLQKVQQAVSNGDIKLSPLDTAINKTHETYMETPKDSHAPRGFSEPSAAEPAKRSLSIHTHTIYTGLKAISEVKYALTPDHEQALAQFEQRFGFTPCHSTPLHWAYITACLSGDTRHLERLKGDASSNFEPRSSNFEPNLSSEQPRELRDIGELRDMPTHAPAQPPDSCFPTEARASADSYTHPFTCEELERLQKILEVCIERIPDGAYTKRLARGVLKRGWASEYEKNYLIRKLGGATP